jgi:diguanylate cyclase (GGDEF)-like protein
MILLHAILGAAAGAFVIHPLSMVIHSLYQERPENMVVILERSLSFEHLYMALFFILLGVIGGIVHGLDAYRLSLLYERVRLLSLTDDLTTLPNRRHFFACLEKNVTDTTSSRSPFSLLILDMDRFKDFNDTKGHPQGDMLLRTFGERVNRLVRSTDIVARYGGEEFAVLMPATPKKTAIRIAERLRNWVEQGMGDERAAETPTLSIGVATCPDDACDASELIQAADDALYRAKRSGRNRTQAAGADLDGFS